ncbi:hypothetical protein CUMW_106650, partial [Citrus unshiu]
LKKKKDSDVAPSVRTLRCCCHWPSLPARAVRTDKWRVEGVDEVAEEALEIELSDYKKVPMERNLILWNSRLLNYWKSSPYFLEGNVEKSSREVRNPKIVRLNADAGLRKLDLYEKLKQKQGQEEKVEKEKNQGEDEDGDSDEAAGEVEEEFSDDGDFIQNIDFDDDGDDFNMADANDLRQEVVGFL